MNATQRASVGLLVLRIAVGSVFLLHGWMKLFGQQISFVQDTLTIVGLQIPGALLVAVAIVEFLAGLALILGLFTRSAATILTVEMLLAVILFHAQQGFFIVAVPSAPLAYGFEFHVSLIGGLLCLAFSGPGELSLGREITARPSP